MASDNPTGPPSPRTPSTADDDRAPHPHPGPRPSYRHTEVVDVHLFLRRGDRVLLARRQGTGYADGLWHAPSGHLEDGEDVARAMLRETREEIGLRLPPEALTAVVAMHHRGPGGAPRVGWFFEAWCEAGGSVPEPVNAEPEKCAEIAWFPLTALPRDMVAYCRAGLDAYRAGRRFVTHWHRDDDPVAYRPEGPDRAVWL